MKKVEVDNGVGIARPNSSKFKTSGEALFFLFGKVREFVLGIVLWFVVILTGD